MNDSFPSHVVHLENGPRVLVLHRPYGKTFAASLAYRVGTFDDPTDLLGIAHFAEHLAFEGPNKCLFAELSAAGAYVNGSTAFQHTEYEISGHIDQLELALTFFANILRTVPVDDEQIRSERQIISHEFASVDIEDRESAMSSFWRHVLGDPNWRNDMRKRYLKRAKRFTTARLNDFRDQYYKPANACLVVISPSSADELQLILERQLPHDLPAVAAPITPAYKPIATVPHTVSTDRFAYAWIDILQGMPNTDVVTRIAANILSRLLGGGPHSEMFQHLRVNHAIAYEVRADAWPYLNGTAIHCFCSVPRRSINQSLDFMMQLFDRIAEQGITVEQLETEKARARSWYEMRMDSPHRLASYLAYEALRPPSEAMIQPSDYLDALNSLSLTTVNQAAADLLSRERRSTFVAARLFPFARFCLRRRINAALRR